jgi:hypothetical protein
VKESEKFQLFSNLNGGLSTRPTPLLVEAGKKMQSPDLKNVNFFRTGGISKRLGKTQEGDTLTATATFSQAGTDTIQFAAISDRTLLAAPFTTTGAVTLGSVEVQIAAEFSVGEVTAELRIYTDSTGSPGTLLATIGSTILASSTTPASVTFSGATASLSATTAYWVVVSLNDGVTPASYVRRFKGQAGTSTKYSTNNGSSWVAAPYDMYFKAYSTAVSTIVQGLYDFRPSPSTRQQLAVSGGNLYKRNKSGTAFINTWTSLYASMTLGQDVLSSFATLKDYAFVSNFANGASRVWDGAAAYTIKQGFRATFSAAASAGGAVTAGTYNIMAVTALKSGGYRASAPVSVTTAAGNLTITISSIVMDGTGATDFGFDIDATATKWFMTAASGSVYYKIPAANMSVANPAPNNTTTFTITALTGLTTANTAIVEYSLPQGYFTSQVDAPAIKYQASWQDFLVMAGDTTNPSRVWFSEQNAPNVWGTFGQIYGNFLDIDDGDGDVITGVFSWNGSLYVSKQHSLHIVEFTGNAAAPFQRRRLPGDIGALSGFTFKDVGGFFVFLSERGIAGCVGSIAQIAPGMENILDLFDPNDADRFNLAACAYSTAGHNRVLGQVWFGVSSVNATTRDKVLIFDYTNKCFWLDDGISGNYFTEVGDANGFFSAWSGSYSGEVFKHDSGLTDNGAAIDWYFTTPHIATKDAYAWKRFDKLMVAGDKQTSGTLSIDLYVDRSSTLTKTISVDMTADRFQTGYLVQLGVRGKTVQMKFRNAEASVPVHIDSFGIYYTDDGVQA